MKQANIVESEKIYAEKIFYIIPLANTNYNTDFIAVRFFVYIFDRQQSNVKLGYANTYIC